MFAKSQAQEVCRWAIPLWIWVKSLPESLWTTEEAIAPSEIQMILQENVTCIHHDTPKRVHYQCKSTHWKFRMLWWTILLIWCEIKHRLIWVKCTCRRCCVLKEATRTCLLAKHKIIHVSIQLQRRHNHTQWLKWHRFSKYYSQTSDTGLLAFCEELQVQEVLQIVGICIQLWTKLLK
jgi:hypothetical protein